MQQKNSLFDKTLLIALLCLGLLVGCGPREVESPTPTPTQQTENMAETPPATETPAPTPTPPAEPLPLSDREGVKGELLSAMEELRQPRSMDISAAGLEEPEMDVRNLYYEILAERPALKYAYDLTVAAEEGRLTCLLSYMPYKTGDFPADFAGEEVSSLQELLRVAEDHLGEGEVPVRITDTALEPDPMNRALQQVGGGYLYCGLNADATRLVYSPPSGMTLEDCMEALDLADRLADEVVEQVITDGMTQMEQARALYAYLTGNVTYDQRYYSDRTHMPYESQTAVGALRDHTAICGGYANALKLLYEKIGIPCYIVSGKYFQEYHAWNAALVEGEWLWFDATTDRGSTGEFGFLRFALTELDETKYHYDVEDIQSLISP